MTTLLRGSAINLIFKIAGLSLGLAITLITAHLGTAERGIYSIFTLIAQVFITFFAGFSAAIAYRISRHQEPPESLVSAALVFALIAGGVFAAGLVAISWIFPSPPYGSLWVLAIAAPILLVVPYVSGVYLGQGDMRRLNWNNIAAPLLCLLLIGAAAWLKLGLTLADVLYAWCLSQIFAAIVTMLLLARHLKLTAPHLGSLAPMIPFAKQIGGTNLIGLLNYRADLLLVQWILGLSAAGVYSVAVAIAEMLWFVSSSVTMAAYSRIGGQGDVESAAFVLRVVHVNLALLLLISPVLFLAAYWAIPYFFGESYRDAVIPLLILLPGVLLYGAASTVSAYFTNRLGRPDLPKKIATVSLVINVALSLLALPLYGISGGALASSVAYAGSMAFSFHLFVKHSHIRWSEVFSPDMRRLLMDMSKVSKVLNFKWCQRCEKS